LFLPANVAVTGQKNAATAMIDTRTEAGTGNTVTVIGMAGGMMTTGSVTVTTSTTKKTVEAVASARIGIGRGRKTVGEWQFSILTSVCARH
jgi:hypothetical protein